MSEEFSKLSELEFDITSMICTNGSNLKCFSGNKTKSETRVVKEHEWVMFLSDGGKTTIDNTVYQIHAGDLRILKPDETVNTTKFGDILVFHFRIKGDRKNKLIENTPSLFHVESIDLKIYIDLFNRMLSKYIDNSEIGNLLLKSRFYDLLTFVLNITKEGKKDSNSAYIEKAKDFINKNYNSTLNLEKIAASVNLHPNYFHKIFKKSLGITPREYLTKIRLNNARNLLLSSLLSVEEISLKCGFDSTSYFIKLFKKEYSITPALYREKMLYSLE